MSQTPEQGVRTEDLFDLPLRVKSLENQMLVETSRPELEIQAGELKYWQELVDKIFEKLVAGNPVAVSLVRCWNKDEKALLDLADRFSHVQSYFPELLAPMVSVNGTPEKGDKDHMTTKAIQKARAEKDFFVVTSEVINYTWTSGLNGPIAFLHQLLQKKGITQEQMTQLYILNQSFDVEMDEQMSEKLGAAVREGKYVLTIREEGDLYTQYPEKKLELSTKIKAAMKDPKLLEDPIFVEEFARAGRNTGMLVPLADLVEMGGFSNACNAMGGMEDHDLYMRLLLKELDSIRRGKGPSVRLKKMLRAFAEPLVYNDPAWSRMVIEGKQAPKVSAEGNAIKNIFDNIQKLWRDVLSASQYETLEENQDFRFDI